MDPDSDAVALNLDAGEGVGEGGDDGTGVHMGTASSDRDLSSDLLDAFTAPSATSPTAIGKFDGHNSTVDDPAVIAAVAAPLGELVVDPNQHNATLAPSQQPMIASEAGGGGESTGEAADPGAIWEPLEFDILSGRGAKVNLNPGNAKFRALCFKKQPEFANGSHVVKRRLATEIVLTVKRLYRSRFLKKTNPDGPWIIMDMEKSIAKACQVMRDYKRPDRLALRDAKGGSKKRKLESTPMDDVPIFLDTVEATIENPFGINDHDVICGRGAYVNSHPGNKRLRQMAIEKKQVFENGTFTEKTALAADIVSQIKSLQPPGRFLKKADTGKGQEFRKGLAGEWEELSDDKAIHKACQVMRDILRPDRLERDLQRKLNSKKRGSVSSSVEVPIMATIAHGPHETEQQEQHHMPHLHGHDILQQQGPLLLEAPPHHQADSGVLEELKDGGAEAGVDISASLELPDVTQPENNMTV